MRPTTPTGRLHALSATAALSVALLAGCGDPNGDPETAPPASSQSSTSRPAEPSTPPPSSPEPSETTQPVAEDDKAAADAEVVVRDYVSFLDEVLADKSVNLDRLDSFLQNPELTEQRDYYTRARDQGFYSNGGTTTFEWIRATNVRVDAKTGRGAVTLRACRNYDDVDARFNNGDKVDTLSPSLGVYQVFNYDYPNPSGWRVAVASSPGERCKP